MSGYRTQARDTALEAERVLIERYRVMSPAEKLALAFSLTSLAGDLALAGARLRHPEASEQELRLRIASARLPLETMRAAYGWPLEPDER